MFNKFLNFIVFLSFVCLSSQFDLEEYASPLDCKTKDLPQIPQVIPNPCTYIDNITSVVEKFSPSNRILTEKLIQSLFNELKLKVNESYHTVKRENENLFSELSTRDSNAANSIELTFSNLAKNKQEFLLNSKACNDYKSDLDVFQSKLNSDGIQLSKQIFCLIASDMKKNMPVTAAVFMFKNGKSLSILDKTERKNIEPFKKFLLKFMTNKQKN